MRLLSRFTRTATAPATVIMRFLTQGGAPVELYRHQWTETHYGTKSTPRKSLDRKGFEWRCNGCDMTGATKNTRMGGAGYSEREPRKSRDDANAHAGTCRAMPHP